MFHGAHLAWGSRFDVGLVPKTARDICMRMGLRASGEKVLGGEGSEWSGTFKYSNRYFVYA